MDPWKVLICDSDKCISEMTHIQNLTNEGNVKPEVLEEYKVYPKVDSPVAVEFKCPRCGKTSTWGTTATNVRKLIYERYGNGKRA